MKRKRGLRAGRYVAITPILHRGSEFSKEEASNSHTPNLSKVSPP